MSRHTEGYFSSSATVSSSSTSPLTTSGEGHTDSELIKSVIAEGAIGGAALLILALLLLRFSLKKCSICTPKRSGIPGKHGRAEWNELNASHYEEGETGSTSNHDQAVTET